MGTAKALTPLLSEPVEGHVYLARPGCGGAGQAPCTEQDALDGNLYKLYLELGGTGPLARTGVHLKVEGRVEANPTTGQLTARFQDNPQLPFSKLEVDLNPGPRAPIDNPATCGPRHDYGGFHAVGGARQDAARCLDGRCRGRDAVIVLRSEWVREPVRSLPRGSWRGR